MVKKPVEGPLYFFYRLPYRQVEPEQVPYCAYERGTP